LVVGATAGLSSSAIRDERFATLLDKPAVAPCGGKTLPV